MSERPLNDINGNLHRSLRVIPQQRDPLAPKKHRVLVRDGDGYSIVTSSEEPIELYALRMQAMHAVTWQNQEVIIVDDEDKMVRHWDDYKPAAWQEPNTPITPENKEVRDRWMLNIIQWLLPPSLAEKIGNPEAQEEIQKTMAEMQVEVAVSPTGCGVVLYRNHEPFAAWTCSND